MSIPKGQYRLLATKPITAPLQTVLENSVNGGDAETFAAARFITACRGEVSWGSRAMDNCKIDLLINFEHPWMEQAKEKSYKRGEETIKKMVIEKEKILILVQVKSGSSYGEYTNDCLRIKKLAIEACHRTSHSICILWVDRDGNDVFWAYIHPRLKPSDKFYGRHHCLTPATRFDLARCMAVPNASGSGAKGLIISKITGEPKCRRKRARSVYKSGALKAVITPTLGPVQLTRLAWKHMFRAGRSVIYKERSLSLIPYLTTILSRFPDDQAIIASEYWESGNYQYRSIEHLLKYRGGQVVLGKPTKPMGCPKLNNVVVVIRLIEEIRFPKMWASKAMLSQEVMRRVVLRSAYYKPERNGNGGSEGPRSSDKTLPKATEATVA
ncbi:hypothetical protein [Synoicihabitans lomoniglobus]|uniref:DUF4365 domain-containing protein n=1 Tax=Synoicihabitans lomoniglobus TaxID=2909285 RepID=A0AAE9ZW47_9BACT|nr:hypothetical protein [Opitutaceae bacterium LMO-M01]WED64184.1 hypothetical protein PXH66_17750 [Opitutaceae bacterium LMO-M01]